jgi:glycosyltransferase involved in cell wall biosynthesis
MRLLMCAQAADKDDTSLSFLLVWITELSRHFESVELVCLKEGAHSLPANVRVHSLGKETARGPHVVKRIRYMARLLWFAWTLRHSYDRVHVFQNEEYLLVAGWLWKALGKPAHLWRNHYDGSFLTNVAAWFARKVFYTSQYSYTARFKHAERMPLGIDLTRFSPGDEARRPNSILFLARMAPSKRAEVLLDAVARLPGSVDVSFVGDPLPQDAAYYASLKELAGKNPKGAGVRFLPGVPNDKTPDAYRSHLISVNTSRSGMYDKTIFEAAACGCLVLASSKDFAADADPRCAFDDGDAASLARQLEVLLSLSESERVALSRGLREMAERNSLTAFGERLAAAII